MVSVLVMPPDVGAFGYKGMHWINQLKTEGIIISKKG